MKIKEVCKQTGLTDKAIRTYIKEGLVFPDYDENYAGRKNYKFSEADVATLKQIAVLRKYNFSIKDIRSLFANETEATDLLNKHITEMKADVNADIDIINSMVNVMNEHPSSNDDMCRMLDTLEIAQKPIPIVDMESQYRHRNTVLTKNNRFLKIVVSVMAIVLVSVIVVLCVLCVILPCFQTVASTDYFAGICVVEVDDIFGLSVDTKYNLEEINGYTILLDNVENPTQLNKSNEKFEKIEFSCKHNKMKIKATFHSNKKYVAVLPVFYNYTDIYYALYENEWMDISPCGDCYMISPKETAKKYSYSYKIDIVNDNYKEDGTITE